MGSTQSTWGSHFDHDPATDPTNETMNALVLVALALGASGQQFQREFDNFVQNPRFNFNQRNNFANDDVVVLNNDALSTSFGNTQQQQQQQRQGVNQFTSDNFQVLAPAPLTNEFSTQFSNSQQQQSSFGASRTNAQQQQQQLQQQSSFGSSNTQGSSFFRTGESSSAFSGQQVGEFEESFGAFEPLNLPSGASVLLGSISSQFSCVGLPYGYYADEDNSCRVFHVCNPLINANEGVETYQYSFMCGEGTQFDQRQLTCVRPEEATPCQETRNILYVNEQFGRPIERVY